MIDQLIHTPLAVRYNFRIRVKIMMKFVILESMVCVRTPEGCFENCSCVDINELREMVAGLLHYSCEINEYQLKGILHNNLQSPMLSFGEQSIQQMNIAITTFFQTFGSYMQNHPYHRHRFQSHLLLCNMNTTECCELLCFRIHISYIYYYHIIFGNEICNEFVCVIYIQILFS